LAVEAYNFKTMESKKGFILHEGVPATQHLKIFLIQIRIRLSEINVAKNYAKLVLIFLFFV
jgi:hypothetical protein